MNMILCFTMKLDHYLYNLMRFREIADVDDVNAQFASMTLLPKV